MTTANITQEVRFAVVLYGGVSLCIYISGVTDELLAMVHATALKADDTPLYPHPKGSAAVYRRIAQYLDTDSTDFALLEQSIPGAPLRTQFIVDVISGTSAGGLNGLFLAKAMARHAGMDGLKKLWLEEGDIQRLLNDSESLQTNGKKEAGLSNPDEPESLLNSQRMYKKLLAVLDTMETSTPEAQEAVKEGNPPKAAAEQIDLYVTTTDLGGLPIKLKLANTVASERRHRSVFHFRYSTQEAGKEQDDFIRANNPFLAFTGRCTSSFPFAFEPMRLIDIEPILENWSDSEGKNPYRPGSGWPNTWEAFYPDYVEWAKAYDGNTNFPSRWFADGGYLDNKPFSYATRTLMRRRAVVPVQRKLLYVEPSPERVPPDCPYPEKPDVITNVLDGLINLPTYETIREDIQQVTNRNKLLELVSRLTAKVDHDLEGMPQNTWRDGNYAKEWVSDYIVTHGLSYGTYHRLKIDQVTRNISRLAGQAAGYSSDSDECLALRWMLDAWRILTYDEKGPGDSHPPKRSETQFLLSFDISYRLRRIFFLQRRINDLNRLHRKKEVEDPTNLRFACPNDLKRIVGDPSKRELFQKALRELKVDLSEASRVIRQAKYALENDEKLKALLLGCFDHHGPMEVSAALLQILENPKSAPTIFERKQAEIQKIPEYLATKLEATFRKASQILDRHLSADVARKTIGARTSPDEAAFISIARIRHSFDAYDQVVFPIQYGTDAEEANSVSILRVSPADAKHIFDENAPAEQRRKLAGTTLFAFGAFLARFWRENDMLWGRLDGAEVIIKGLLSGSPAADNPSIMKKLLDEASEAIIEESLTADQRQEICNLLGEAWAAIGTWAPAPGATSSRAMTPKETEAARAALLGALQQLYRDFPDIDTRMRKVLKHCVVGYEPLSFFQEKYQVRRTLALSEQFRNGARAVRITARILDGLAAKHGTFRSQTGALARIASVLLGIVEISIPGSLARSFWKHWREILYITGGLLLPLSFLLPQALSIGLIIIGATLLIDLICWALRETYRGERGTALAACLFLFLLALVGSLLFAGWRANDWWRGKHPANPPSPAVSALHSSN